MRLGNFLSLQQIQLPLRHQINFLASKQSGIKYIPTTRRAFIRLLSLAGRKSWPLSTPLQLDRRLLRAQWQTPKSSLQTSQLQTLHIKTPLRQKGRLLSPSLPLVSLFGSSKQENKLCSTFKGRKLKRRQINLRPQKNVTTKMAT